MCNIKSNAILDANGGLDSARALATALAILFGHDLRQPVLYHLVITGSETVKAYQVAIKALVRRLRNYGCRTEYFGAFEMQPMKGLHAHVFLLIETSKKTPFAILDIAEGKYLHKLATKNGLQRIHVAKPKNKMHGGDFFARPVGDKLENCAQWITYIYKARSKESVPSRETYFNSEFAANKAIRDAEMQRWLAPAPGKSKSVQINLTKGSSTLELTAAENYVASLYEEAIDHGLDVEAIRVRLAARGVRKTPAQVTYDLDHVFEFFGYADAHPAPIEVTVAEVDREIDGLPKRVLNRAGATSKIACYTTV